MPLPNRQQTFYESCRDLLEKLDREIDRYRSIVGGDDHNVVDELKDIAFNASVTAWQLGDWVFHDMTDEQRQELGFNDTKALLEHARAKCRALHLCRHAATASKHWEVTQYPDPNVQTDLTHEDGWRVVFVDDNKRIAADQVFAEALNFWTNFIYSNHIAKWKCARCLDTYWVCEARGPGIARGHVGAARPVCRAPPAMSPMDPNGTRASTTELAADRLHVLSAVAAAPGGSQVKKSTSTRSTSPGFSAPPRAGRDKTCVASASRP